MTKQNTKPNFDKLEYSLPTGWLSSYDMEYLYKGLKDSTKDDVYLELGVERGRSLALARKYFNGDVYGIDIIDNRQVKTRGTNYILKNSLEVEWTLPIKMLFIDSDHRYEHVKAEWKKYSPFIVKGGWVFFHDCDETSEGVVRAFREIDGKQWKKGKSNNPRCSMAWVQKC